jgi:parallel beta-helix repeat protein
MNKLRNRRTVIFLLIGIFLAAASARLPSNTNVAQAQENPATPRERLPTQVSFWGFDEPYGAIVQNGGSNPGTHTSGVRAGAPRLISGSPPGYAEIYYSADYNGTTGRTSVNSNSSLNLTSVIALEAWIRPDTLPPVAAAIMHKESQYSLRLLSNGAIAFRLWIGGTVKEITTPAGTITAGKIYHLFAAYEGANQVIYVNGIVKKTQAQTGLLGTSANPLLFGASLSGGSYQYYFDGRIDHATLYSSVPSATWVLNRYNSLADNTAPDTAITLAPPANIMNASARFDFRSAESASTFQCKLDGGAYAACTSPKIYAGLATGSHSFSVRAIDPSDNIDQTPATHAWTVASPSGPACTKVATPGINLRAFTDTLAPGDVGCLHAGTYGARGVETFMTVNGTASAPITLKGYPGEAMPTILGYFPIGGQYIVISGLLFDGPTGQIPGISDPETAQISIYGSNVEINHCEIRNSRGHAGIYLESAFNTRLIGNYIHDNGNFSDPATANLDHGIYFGSGSGLIANNLIEHNYAFGIHLYPSASNIIVQQNTIVRNGRSGIIIADDPDDPGNLPPTNNLIVNNIVAYNTQNSIISYALPCGGNNIVRKNLVWANGNGNIGNDTNCLTLVNNIQADPRFIGASDYRLQFGSPAIDAADNPYTQPDDYRFVLRPQGVASDIGAFEFVQPSACTKVATPGTNLRAFTDTLIPGDVGCLRAGTYGARGTENFITVNGTASAPITLKGYPGEAIPTILGFFPIGGQYLVISGLLFDGPTGPMPAYSYTEKPPISIYGSNVEINHCEIRNSLEHAGIYLENAFNTRLIGNYIHDNGNFNNPGTANLDHGIYFGSGSGLIANNLIEHNYAFGIHLYPSASNVTVQQNTIVRNGRSGVIIADEPDDPGNLPPTNNLIVNNVVAYNAQNSIISWALPCGGNNVVRKNLVWGNGNGNLGNDTNCLTLVNNIQADPRFIGDFLGVFNYSLQAGSPAIDAADNPYTQPDDYALTARPQGSASDIGAFEFYSQP